MTDDYFCPKCDKKYGYRQIENMIPEEGLGVGDLVRHFLCSCGYEGRLYENSDIGMATYTSFLKNQIQYCDDVLAACPGDEYWIQEKKRLQGEYKRRTGRDVEEKKRSKEIHSAFSAWTNS